MAAWRSRAYGKGFGTGGEHSGGEQVAAKRAGGVFVLFAVLLALFALALLANAHFVQQREVSSPVSLALAAPGDPAIEDEGASEQYYLYGPEQGGANVVAAWAELADAGIAPANQVDVAVLDTGAYAMRYRNGDVGYFVGGNVSDDYLHQEFDARNLATGLGRDFVHADGSALPLVNAPTDSSAGNPTGDDNGHGTHVSAIIAAHAASAYTPGELPFGMAGASPYARVIPMKVLDANGECKVSDLVDAYNYLIGLKRDGTLPNLRVINMSFSVTDVFVDEGEEGADGDVADEGDAADADPSEIVAVDDIEVVIDEPEEGSSEQADLYAAIDEAAQEGIVTVCAAGNDASGGETFPGNYATCVCVTALGTDGGNAGFSNFNGASDISAPGTDIYSAWANQADGYAKVSGTSQAAAIVSGAFSLVFAANPSLTVNQAKAAVYKSATPLASPEETRTNADGKQVRNASQGAVDAAAAVRFAMSGEAGGSFDDIDRAGQEGDYVVEDDGGEGGDDPGSAGDDLDDSDGTSGQGGSSGTGGSGKAGDSSGASASASSGSREDGTAAAKKSLAKAIVKTSKTSYAYTGKALKPAVTVKLSGKKLVRGRDYTVSYASNKKPGKAKLTVKGKGAFKGSKTVAFKIKLAKTKIKKLKAGKKSMTVKWKRQKKGNVGYQIRCSTKKSMKGAKIRTVKRNAKTALKVTKLKSGKRYYVQVRTYKKIGKAKKHSAWSAKKSVKVR